MFGISRADGARDGALLIAPALAASLQGRDVEEVLLLRDEAANLAWAIERAVEGEDGLPADQAQAAHEAVPPAPPSPRPAGTLPYRLRTDPPPHWFPLLPQRARPTDPSMTFRLGALPARRAGRSGDAAAPARPSAGADVEGPQALAARGRGPARGRARHPRLPTRALDRRHARTSGSAGARRSAAARDPAACASTPRNRRSRRPRTSRHGRAAIPVSGAQINRRFRGCRLVLA